MALYRQWTPIHFTPETPVEKHFHDYDETWVISGGRCRAYLIDHEGRREEFDLESGDIWMVEAGVEHGCDPYEGGVDIFPFAGTIPAGSHAPGRHYYMEQEGYIPRLRVEKTVTDRYGKDAVHA
jgi:hypothetical protein